MVPACGRSGHGLRAGESRAALRRRQWRAPGQYRGPEVAGARVQETAGRRRSDGRGPRHAGCHRQNEPRPDRRGEAARAAVEAPTRDQVTASRSKTLPRGLLLPIALGWCVQAFAQIAPTAAEYARYTGLFAAAARNDTTKIVKLLRAGEYAGVRDSHGRTPLHVAAYRRNHDAMRVLVRATHDPNVL